MSTEILDVDDTDSGWFQGKTMNIKYLPIYFLKHLEKTCYCKDLLFKDVLIKYPLYLHEPASANS